MSEEESRMGENEFSVGKSRVSLVQGDITKMDVDAVVNAANSTLMGGGGVDGAIHRAGGPAILEECRSLRATKWPEGLPTGEAVMTTGGKLRAMSVIHTVGPVWRDGRHGEPELLAEAYRNCLDLAASKGLKSVAFPSISTGAYGYPVEKACRIALETTRKFLDNAQILDVVFVLFSKNDFEVYVKNAKELLQEGAFSALP
jgi:O-acetyl-ADP-ribose deacetylase (regulator of RNase III)